MLTNGASNSIAMSSARTWPETAYLVKSAALHTRAQSWDGLFIVTNFSSLVGDSDGPIDIERTITLAAPPSIQPAYRCFRLHTKYDAELASAVA